MFSINNRTRPIRASVVENDADIVEVLDEKSEDILLFDLSNDLTEQDSSRLEKALTRANELP